MYASSTSLSQIILKIYKKIWKICYISQMTGTQCLFCLMHKYVQSTLLHCIGKRNNSWVYFMNYMLCFPHKKGPEIKSRRSSHRIANNFVGQSNGIYVKFIIFCGFCGSHHCLHNRSNCFSLMIQIMAAMISRSSLSFRIIAFEMRYSIIIRAIEIPLNQ